MNYVYVVTDEIGNVDFVGSTWDKVVEHFSLNYSRFVKLLVEPGFICDVKVETATEVLRISKSKVDFDCDNCHSQSPSGLNTGTV